MQKQEILKFIGNGQITIPQSWRILLNMKDQVQAIMQDDKVIIQSINFYEEDLDWDVKKISINDLDKSDQKLIKEARKDYKSHKVDKFISLEKFLS